MANILEAFLKLNTSDFSRGAKTVQKDAEQLKTATQSAGDGLRHMDNHLQNVHTSAAAAGLQINQLAAAISTVLVAGAAFSFGNQVLQTASSFETLLVRLESIKGSAEAAEKSLEWIEQFDADAPLFQLQTIADGYADLSMTGLEAEKIMRQIGDAVAGTGGNEEKLQGVITAFVQMKAKGKASAEELQQIAERGIPAFQILKEKLELTSKQMNDIGNAGYTVDEIIQALVDGMDERFGGQMQAQSDLFNGLVANMQNKWMQFLRRIGESGALDYFKTKLSELIAQWEAWDADGTLQRWATGISNTMIAMAQLVEMLIRGGATVIQFVANNHELLLLLAGLTLGVGALTTALTLTTGALTSTAVAAKTVALGLGPIGMTLMGIAAGYAAMDTAARQSNASMEASLGRMKETLDTLKFFREAISTLDGSGIVSDGVVQQVQQIRAAVMAGSMAKEDGIAIVQKYLSAVEGALQQQAELEQEIANHEQLRHELSQKLQQQTTADTLAYVQSLQQVADSNADERIRAINDALQQSTAGLSIDTDASEMVRLHEEATMQILAVEQERADQALAYAEQIYQTKSEKIHQEVQEAAEQATQLKAITRELAESRIAAVQRQYEATRSALNKARTDHANYVAQVQKLDSDITAEQQRQADTLQDMRRADMSAAMQYVDKRREFAQLSGEYEQAIAQGNLQQAENIARRRETLAKELANSEMSLADMKAESDAMLDAAEAARRDGNMQQYRQLMGQRKQLVKEISAVEKEAAGDKNFSMRERGLKMVEDAYAQINGAMQQQKAEAQAAATAQQAQVEKLTGALEGLGGTLGEFRTELTELEVEVNTRASEAALDKLKAKLDELRDKTITVTVNQQGGSGFNQGGSVPQAFATGGRVSGPGGIDNVPAWLTAGEFVINNQQNRASQLRPLLEFLNTAPLSQIQQRLGEMMGFPSAPSVPTLPQHFYEGGVVSAPNFTPQTSVAGENAGQHGGNVGQRFEVVLVAPSGEQSPPLSGEYSQAQEMVSFLRRVGTAT